MDIEKYIAYQIESQFPSIYLENGPELVQLVKSYYDFLETVENQSAYNSRRIFEYRDIDSTLDRFLVFFKNQFLKDLPFNEDTIRIATKNILSLYRRKGTKEGIEHFFKMFYDEYVTIYTPSKDILKVSDSNWVIGQYIELKDVDSLKIGQAVGKRIYGKTTKSQAIADNIFFAKTNGIYIPIIFLKDLNGRFEIAEDITFRNNENQIERIGTVFGSLNSIDIIEDPDFEKTNNNEKGDNLTVNRDSFGIGAKVAVEEVTQIADGAISSELIDGGWGYSIENTLVLASNQSLILEDQTRKFKPFDVLEDDLGNRGIVIGQRLNVIGIRMDDGSEFTESSVIYDANSSFLGISQVYDKNESFPGPLYPENPLEEFPVKVDELSNTTQVGIITDTIGDFLNVQLNSANYNDVPPALAQMSGNNAIVDINTNIEDAFDIESITIGKIENIKNIRAGANYPNTVFAIVHDPLIAPLYNRNQILVLDVENVNAFTINETISQSGLNGLIVDKQDNMLYVRPYGLEGFVSGQSIDYGDISFQVLNVSNDYQSSVSGYNANLLTELVFENGKIISVRIIDSGYGYIDGQTVTLIDSSGNPAAKGRIVLNGVGTQEGYWSTYSSHIGTSKNKRIQDSDYYQEYSYEIRSKLNINTYESVYKENMHLVGNKLFTLFDYEDLFSVNTDINLIIEE